MEGEEWFRRPDSVSRLVLRRGLRSGELAQALEWLLLIFMADAVSHGDVHVDESRLIPSRRSCTATDKQTKPFTRSGAVCQRWSKEAVCVEHE